MHETVLRPDEYADVEVTIDHPWGAIVAPLELWIARGPGPRPYVSIVAARRISTGDEIPLKQIPLEFHNSSKSRRLQRQGLLPCPWGPPPDD